MAGDRFPVRAGQQVLFLVRAGQRVLFLVGRGNGPRPRSSRDSDDEAKEIGHE